MTVPMFGFRTTLLVLGILSMIAPAPVFGEQDDPENLTEIEVEKETASINDDTEEEPEKKKSFWERQKEKDPNRGRFLPIPIFITEPAIGDGLGLVLSYFHPKNQLFTTTPAPPRRARSHLVAAPHSLRGGPAAPGDDGASV
jgi:hypothetical protein